MGKMQFKRVPCQIAPEKGKPISPRHVSFSGGFLGYDFKVMDYNSDILIYCFILSNICQNNDTFLRDTNPTNLDKKEVKKKHCIIFNDESISLSSSKSYMRGEIGYVTEVNLVRK